MLLSLRLRSPANGNEIKKPGRPLPVEYLLVDVPVGTPVEELFTMVVIQDKNKFPVENRQIEGHLQVSVGGEGFLFATNLYFFSEQDFNAFAKYMTQFRSAEFLDSVSDLHVLLVVILHLIPPTEVQRDGSGFWVNCPSG